VLYGGLMKTPDGIKVIEFNARFGDPETEVVLPRLRSDILDVFMGVINGEDISLQWDDRVAMGIVLASKGYPGDYAKGFEISGVENVDGIVYHMGTARKEGKLVTNGGRVMLVTVFADNFVEAQHKANAEIEKIKCDNLFHRTDIAWQAIEYSKRK
jgi:phosphoribosylamine--glycine ligase